jgi:SAM-dependent methyltransferase
VSLVCPSCSAPNARQFGVRDGYNARLCEECSHIFVAETPSEAVLAALYASYGYDEGSLDGLPAFIFDILGELVATFEPYRKTGRWLDVGFGAGSLLRVARTRDWETFGVEASLGAVESGRRHALGELILGNFATVPLESHSFDVVTMSELVEHLPDPRPFLQRASEVLRPGGVLYLTTPHGRGLSGRILGPTWSVMKPPEHLHLYSTRSLALCLRRAGFDDISIYTQGLLPHELVAHVRGRLASRATAASPEGFTAGERNAGGYRVNARLTGTRLGRFAKQLVNRGLRMASLGDSLRAYARTPG